MSAIHAAAQLFVAVAAATPSPTPTGPSADSVTPGPWGFAAIFFVGLLTIAIIWDMVRRIRRMTYRAQVQAKLDAEEAALLSGEPAPTPSADSSDPFDEK